jgi:hypothetical protein
MSQKKDGFAGAVALAALLLASSGAGAADVSGYSILKGHFLNQTGPDTLVSDPDFGFSILAFVEATDYDLITNGTLRLPGGSRLDLDDYSDSWGILDTYDTLAGLNAAYGAGNYTMSFETVNDGSFSCILNMPNTALPPMPQLVNYDAVQSVVPSAPLVLNWTFSSAPKSNDFVQVYINLGHGEVFSTPNIGEPGALDFASRTVTVPEGRLEAGNTYSLNIEITRLFTTNSTSYPDAQGVTGMFSSTSVNFTPLWPPLLVFESSPSSATVAIDVLADPGRQVVLQISTNMVSWTDFGTNVSESISNLFNVPKGAEPMQFFRARQQ